MNKGITITICTYNGKNRIAKAITSIAMQKNVEHVPIELVIVDNMSTDGTLDFCKSHIQEIEFPFEVKYLIERKQGAINARIKALQEAKYEWLLICDDDNELEKNYINTAFSILQNNNKIGALGGYGVAVFESTKPDWFEKYCSSYAVEKQNIKDGKIEKYNASIYGAGGFFNATILKNIYQKNYKTLMVGPNQKELTRGEDTEWCYLLLLNNFEIWYSSKLLFKHHLTTSRLSWSYYLQLKKGISSGAALLFSYHFILKQKKINTLFFFAKYFRETIYNILLALKCKANSIIKKTKENELGLVIAKAKAISYLKSFSSSFHSYQNILKLVNQ